MWIKVFGQEAPYAITEIVILWAMVYLLLKSVRGTRAMHVVQFMVLLLLLSYLCRTMNLATIYWVLTSAQLPCFIGLVILYAPELRRAVTEMTRTSFFQRSRNQDDPICAEAAQAAQVLSKRHIGALIVFERYSSLQGFIDTGIRMDSYVSSELLVTIFSPLTPLHDGAVILRNGRVAAAACLLPLSEREQIDSSWGMRHRAALGLAEETDAVVVIVSEETGGVSLAINGRITRQIDVERFPSILTNVLKKRGSS
ncbi:MAG: diadenylate cyclase CdaA [Candidatus Omnitrophota bacterium]